MRPGGWREPAARRVGRALALGVAVSVGVTVVSRVGVLAGWETRAVDAFLFLRDRVPAPEIVIVAIDDEAFREMGERQPLSRRYLADLGEFLLQSGARVVAFDVVFEAPTDPSEDAALVAMSRRWEREGANALVFSARAVAREGGTPERYALVPAFSPDLKGFLGFPNAPVDDGVVRRMAPVYPSTQGGFIPAFSVAVLAAYAKQTPDGLMRALGGQPGARFMLPARGSAGAISEEPIPIASLAGPPWRVDYVGPKGTFTMFPSGPLVRLVRSGARPDPDNPFRGKIVLVGATFADSRDAYWTPLFSLMPGVEIQANMVQTLLARRVGQPPHWALNLAVLIGTCLTVAVLSVWLRPIWVAAVTVGLVVVFALASYGVYVRGGYWLDFVAPLAGMVAYLQGSRLLARRRLRSAFGQFVSPEVMDRVLQEGAALGGELRTVSVLMSDLRGFTTLSEKLPPDRISEIMNEYFTAMVEVILAHKGMINDFIGDGILAVYGAPADDPEHAWHAVTTALEMHQALRRLNQRWEAGGGSPLAMGVAVNSGEVFAGNLGSPRRKKYTVLGDTVNTVARVEGLNRELATAILISGATLAAVKDRVVVRERGAVPVKGRAQPVEVFELLDMREAVDGPPGGRA